MPIPADVIITNARVYTVDPANPGAEAVAVSGRRIAFVGRAQEVKDWQGPGTRIVDAQQGTLLPGSIDSHFHLLSGSLKLGDIRLDPVDSLDSLAAAVRAFAARQPDEPWLVGQGLRYSVRPPDQPLTRHQLDEIVADRPLILFAYDLHTAWANTAALRRAGLLEAGEPVAPNSEIVRDATGQASGELRERGAYGPVMDLIPPPTEARQRQLLNQGLAQLAALGLTSVYNMDGDAGQLARYATLEQAGELTLRVYVPFNVTPETPPEALAEAVAMRETHQSDMVRGGCVKFFMDGVIETYTGLLVDDYDGQPGRRGGANFSLAHFTRMATEADRLGLQISVHAVGDGAVRRTLDGYAAVQGANGRRDSRHRIEHIELIHSADLPRFADLGVIASMQPSHAPMPLDLDPWPDRVGPARWGCSFAWQTLRRAGAHLVFGSDWPVAGPNPLDGFHAALNRPLWAPGLPDQRQTLPDIIAAYTRDAAYAEFQEHHKGQLRPGFLADMVLLSDDLFAVPTETINRVHSVLTMCDGRIVYEA